MVLPCASSGRFRDYFKMHLAFWYNKLLFKSGLDYSSENIRYRHLKPASEAQYFAKRANHNLECITHVAVTTAPSLLEFKKCLDNSQTQDSAPM